MKKIIFLFALFLLPVLSCFAEDPVEGYWVSIDDQNGKTTAGWHIYAEGGKLYGKILSIPDYSQDVLAAYCKKSYKGFPVAGDVSKMTVLGTPWIFGLTMESYGHWTGGNIIDPNNGGMYNCKITFHPAGELGKGKKNYSADTLEMRAEVGMGIGRSQFWRKCTQAEAVSLR
ncbi:MAG: DUF2147 domain-containing protein [Termitinemataceae bacterium]|nr:MAG: DUF2147 domain-containing protein [Termitinemataceae bacterium]